MVSKKEAKDWAREHVKGLWGLHWTPYNEDYSVDEDGLRRHMKLVVEQELDGICVGGLLAEMWYLTTEERLRIGEIVQEEAAGRVPTAFIATDHSIAKTLELVRAAQDMGSDMAFVQVPYEHAKSSEAMYRFVEYINDNSDIALAIYDTPHSGRVMGPELLNEVTKIEGVCAVKHGPDFAEFVRSSQLVGDRAVVSFPFEAWWPAQMQLLGTRAFFSSTTPHLFQSPSWQPIREYTNLALNGEWDKAYELFYSLQPLRDLWTELYRVYHEDNRHPIAEVKYWVYAQGMIDSPRVRPNQKQVDPEVAAKIDAAIEAFPQLRVK